MAYAIKSTKQFDTDFVSFSGNLQDKLKESLAVLKEKPYAGKRLHGTLKGLYSLRSGNYRVVYSVDETKKTIILYFIGHRKNIYER